MNTIHKKYSGGALVPGASSATSLTTYIVFEKYFIRFFIVRLNYSLDYIFQILLKSIFTRLNKVGNGL